MKEGGRQPGSSGKGSQADSSSLCGLQALPLSVVCCVLEDAGAGPELEEVNDSVGSKS